MTRGPYVAPAPIGEVPDGWSVLPIGDVDGLAHAVVFNRRLHDLCQTDRPFTPNIVTAIEQRGWQHAATNDNGTQFWLRDRAAVTIDRILRARRADLGRSLL
ncbi:MAG: hypothetical protein QOI95_2130 [Acidimicrobiaceae bacterium]|jgi:hypothetical protein